METQMDADLQLKNLRRSVLSHCDLVPDDTAGPAEIEEDTSSTEMHPPNHDDETINQSNAVNTIISDEKVKKYSCAPTNDTAVAAAIAVGVGLDATAAKPPKASPAKATKDVQVGMPTKATEPTTTSCKKKGLSNKTNSTDSATAVGFGVPTVNEPTLSRQVDLTNSIYSLPGAYSVAGPSNTNSNNSLFSTTSSGEDIDDESCVDNDDNARGAEEAHDIESLFPRRPGMSWEEQDANNNPSSQNSGKLTVASKVTEDTTHWPQAQEVGQEEAEEYQRAARMKRRQEGRWSFFKIAAAVLLCLSVFIVIVVILAFSLEPSEGGGANNEDKPPSNSTSAVPPSQSPTTLSPEEYLLSHLSASTLKEILNGDNDSPQKQAYEWMLMDPNLMDYSQDRLLQRLALATLFYSTTANGEWVHSDDWLSFDVHECEWYNYHTNGFYDYPETETGLFYNITTAPCDDDGFYEHLWLVQNDLEGTLPEELYLLSSLKSISLDRNKLGGTISSHIGRLTNLEALALFTNDMTGMLPSQLGLLTNLEYLWVMSNGWTGSIPTELGLLSDSLVYLLVDNNQMTGSFPSELGRLSNLLWLWLYNNQLTGSLPTEMGLMETVGSVAIDFNNFDGTIPTEVGLMTNMWTFHIEKSFISGTIPTEFGLCTDMYSLAFPRTLITGTIPSEIGLTNVERRLWGYSTLLTGTVPTELGLLTRLETMDFNNNSLTGPLPSELGSMEMVWRVHFSENHLTGTLPTVLGNLQNLWTFDLSNNHLTGVIPSQLGAVDSIVDFWDEASNATVEYWNITYLQLDNNRFSGVVPSTLGLLRDLTTLSIHNNSDLTGEVPSSFCDMGSQEEGEEGLTVSVDCALVDCNCTVCSCV